LELFLPEFAADRVFERKKPNFPATLKGPMDRARKGRVMKGGGGGNLFGDEHLVPLFKKPWGNVRVL